MELTPIELNLDKPRKVLLNAPALLRAEQVVNRRRGGTVFEWVSIDYLIWRAAAAETGFPLDLVAALLWSGLVEADSNKTKNVLSFDGGYLSNIKFEDVVALIDQSAMHRGDILRALIEHYESGTTRKPKTTSAPDIAGNNDGGQS